MGDEARAEGFVATLDIGTSSVRCLIINKNGDHVGSSRRPVSTSVLQPLILIIVPLPHCQSLFSCSNNLLLKDYTN